MHVRRRPRIARVAILGWLGLAGAASAAGQAPSADEIIDRAVERVEEQRVSEADLEFEATVEMMTEHLNKNREVERIERATYRQYPLEGALFEELVARDGQPLSADDARDEARRRQKFIETVRERKTMGEDPVPEDENRVDFNEEFVARYQFSLVGEELVDGRPCWIVELEPREGKLPVRRRIDTALNNAVGRVWVSQDDYGLARVEFEMSTPVRFWGGILGTLRNTVGRLEFTQVADRVWLPTTIDIELDLRILFRSIRRRFVREWVEYAPVRAAN